MENTEQQKPEEQISIILASSGLLPDKVEVLQKRFLAKLQEGQQLKDELDKIVIDDISQTDRIEKAKTIYLKLVKIRTGLEADRKTDMEFYKKMADTIALLYKTEQGIINPWEEAAKQKGRYIEIEQERIRQEKLVAKKAIMDAIVDENNNPYSYFDETIKNYSDKDFDAYVRGIKSQIEEAKTEHQKELEALAEKQRIDDLHKERKESILNLWSFVPEDKKVDNFGNMSNEDWNILHSSLQTAKMNYDKEQIKLNEDRTRLENEAKQKEAELLKLQQDNKDKEEQLKLQEEAKKQQEATSEVIRQRFTQVSPFFHYLPLKLQDASADFSKYSQEEWDNIVTEAKSRIPVATQTLEQPFQLIEHFGGQVVVQPTNIADARKQYIEGFIKPAIPDIAKDDSVCLKISEKFDSFVNWALSLN